MNKHALEIKHGERFRFGENWCSFLSVLDDDRIIQAEISIKEYLGYETLEGLTFLDVGSGSGLFSLAARRLGATVYSFDYDPESVECTRELKRRYFDNDNQWVIDQGSALDEDYIDALGKFDIVYSWGVLHHTGDMYRAMGCVQGAVKDGGDLFISIYNYQVYWTSFHVGLKRCYNQLPRFGKWVIAGLYIGYQMAVGLVRDIIFLQSPVKRYTEKKKSRGMSMWYDWIDWIGGYPFEVAKPETIFDFFFKRGFFLKKLKTVGGGFGCNEYVFRKGRS